MSNSKNNSSVKVVQTVFNAILNTELYSIPQKITYVYKITALDVVYFFLWKLREDMSKLVTLSNMNMYTSI